MATLLLLRCARFEGLNNVIHALPGPHDEQTVLQDQHSRWVALVAVPHATDDAVKHLKDAASQRDVTVEYAVADRLPMEPL